MNVGMACPPVEFIDETVPSFQKCYYRIRLLQSIWMPQVPIDDIGFIGDPFMVPPGFFDFAPVWPDNRVELTLVELPEPSVPIIAPEIRLTP